MMNETPEAALRSRIADLEQQLKLADEGTSRLAQRCLELEKQLQTFYVPTPRKRGRPTRLLWCSRCFTMMPGSAFPRKTPSRPRTTNTTS